MPQSELETIRQAYDAIWKRGDVDAAMPHLAEDVEWITPQNPEGPVRRGRESVASFFREFLDSFETIEANYEFTPVGNDRIVVAGMYRGRGKGSGVEVETPLGQIWTVKDGQGVRMEWFATGEKALEAAGLQAMAQNVKIVREFSELFEKGDRDAWRESFHPDVVWDVSASELPGSGVYHGHAGVERFFRDWLGTWTDYEVANSEFIEVGDAVVVVFHQTGTGRGSGVRTERDFFGIYDLKDSKVIRFRLYESREEALEAAGASG